MAATAAATLNVFIFRAVLSSACLFQTNSWYTLLSSCCVITGRTCMLPKWHWCFWLLAIFPIPLHQPWHLFSVTVCLPVTKRAKLHSMVTGLYGFVTIQSMESPAPEKGNIFCLGKGGFTGTKMEQNFHHLCILPTDKSQKSPWDRNFYLT